MITAELEAPPYLVLTTPFVIAPPKPTTPGLTVLTLGGKPSEGANTAAIIDVEFAPEFADEEVSISANLHALPCALPPLPTWLGPLGLLLAEGGEVTKVLLDHESSAFVVLLLGRESCSTRTNVIQASLEQAPYTTFVTEFANGPI